MNLVIIAVIAVFLVSLGAIIWRKCALGLTQANKALEKSEEKYREHPRGFHYIFSQGRRSGIRQRGYRRPRIYIQIHPER